MHGNNANTEAISQRTAFARDGYNHSTKYKGNRNYSKRHGLGSHKSKERK